MTSAKNTVSVTKRIDNLDKVRRAWNPDRGYIIVGFDDKLAMSEVTRILEDNEYIPFDIDHNWLVDGKEVTAMHFCHESEKENWIEPRI